MRTRTKIIIGTIALAIPMFFAGSMIWPNAVGTPSPSSQQLPFFILLAVIEALVSGLGISTLIFGWKWVRQSPPENQALNILTLFSFAWILGQWWAHGNMHRWNGYDLQGLLYIDYGFHVTVIIASVILLYSFVKQVFLRRQSL